MIAAGVPASAASCRLCGGAVARSFTAREMMLGLREPFTYHECGGCGSLQLADVPADLDRFYPERYYSFTDGSASVDAELPSWCLTMGNVLAAAVVARARGGRLSRRELAERAVAEYFAGLGLDEESRILDIGCGGGPFLADLAALGFRRLRGIDPYLDEEREVAPGVRVVRCGLAGVEPAWDLVMLHHCFEHLADPPGALRQVAALLAPGGVCLIRTPIVPCEAWERFGVDWMQLDPPRHLFVHSLAGLRRLAEQAGLGIERAVFDAGFLSSVVSEQYRRSIPMLGEGSFVLDPLGAGPSGAEINALIWRARWLNSQGRGDQVAVVLARRPGRREDPR
jgi:SAM-dependent methyltransferase